MGAKVDDMTKSLAQVYLMTPDLDASTEFFENDLGLTKTDEGDGTVSFDTGRCELKLESDFDEETLAAFGLEPPGEERGDGVVVVIEVEDVEGTFETAEAAGAEILLEPTEVEWGRKMFLVRSPTGYTFEISRPL